MKSSIRLLVLALAGTAALALAGTALAAYTTPTLVVTKAEEQIGGGGPTTIRAAVDIQDDPTARVTIYAPQGYTSSIVQPLGTTIGTASAIINARDIGPEARVPVTGNITSEDPAQFAQQAAQCVGPGIRVDTVWLLRLTAAGQTINLPAYVSAVSTGPEAAFASVKIVVCLGNPGLPTGNPARATLGAKLLEANLTLRGVFTNPVTPGEYRWRALFTPYFPGAPAAGTTGVNATGSVEVQSATRLPVSAVITGVRLVRGRAVVTGRVTQNRAGVGGATVRLLVGRTARGVKGAASGRTTANGTFTISVRIRKKGTYFFRARASRVAAQTSGCTQTFAPLPCLRTASPAFQVDSAVARRRFR